MNSHEKKRVLVLGRGKLAIRISQWFLESSDYELITVIPDQPEPTWTDSFSQWARSNKITVVESGRCEDIAGIHDENWRIDLGFSVYHIPILKPWFIQKCERLLNLHNAPLPRYRGVSPINWALKNNEMEHGVTIHEITPGIDDGPIVAQAKFTINPETDEVIDVYNRCLNFAWCLFQETMPRLDSIIARPQDHSKATYYSKKENQNLEERLHFTRSQLPV